MSDSQVLASITFIANAVMFLGAGFGWLRARRRTDGTASLYALFTLLGLTGACVGAAILVRPANNSVAWLLTGLAAFALCAFALVLWRHRQRMVPR